MLYREPRGFAAIVEHSLLTSEEPQCMDEKGTPAHVMFYALSERCAESHEAVTAFA